MRRDATGKHELIAPASSRLLLLGGVLALAGLVASRGDGFADTLAVALFVLATVATALGLGAPLGPRRGRR